MKNIVIISSTLRKNGNSELLAKEFENGAKASNHDVEFISLQNKEINFCKGCFACQKIGTCVIKDSTNEIVEKMKNADIIVFASPIYYYEISGQLKTLLDRANPLYSSDYKFKDIYFLASSADESSHAIDIALNGIKGWIACFSRANLKGALLASGVNDIGDIQNNPILNKAYEMGKNC